MAGPGSGAGPYLDVLQQVLHVGDCEAVEEGVRLMHLHGQIVVLRADVLGQQVNGLGPPIPDTDLGAAGSVGGRGVSEPRMCMPSLLKTLPTGVTVWEPGEELACRMGW